MLWFVGLLGYLFGYMIAFSLALLGGINEYSSILAGFAGGGIFSLLAMGAYWLSVIPPAIRKLVKAARTGILVIAVGSDKKLRFLPGTTDGFVIRPVEKPYNEKYVWAADGESAYPVHEGKGMQAILTYMGYPFPIAADKAAAISKFKEKGFRSLEELKLATELPSLKQIDERIQELQREIEIISNMDDEKIKKEYGIGKEDVLREYGYELERLRRVRELVEHSGGGDSLTVNIDGATIKARDLITYLVWRHHPSELNRIVKAETNAILSRMNPLDWLKLLLPVIIVTGMVVIGVIAVVYMITHGGSPHATPLQTISIGG